MKAKLARVTVPFEVDINPMIISFGEPIGHDNGFAVEERMTWDMKTELRAERYRATSCNCHASCWWFAVGS